MAVILGLVSLGFSAIGAYALFAHGWSFKVFGVTSTTFTVAVLCFVGGLYGPGKLPAKGYSTLGGGL